MTLRVVLAEFLHVFYTQIVANPDVSVSRLQGFLSSYCSSCVYVHCVSADLFNLCSSLSRIRSNNAFVWGYEIEN